jgi:hypothetical protein
MHNGTEDDPVRWGGDTKTREADSKGTAQQKSEQNDDPVRWGGDTKTREADSTETQHPSSTDDSDATRSS